MNRTRSALLLVALLVLCFAAAAVGGLSTASSIKTWYPTLDKPPWTPPNWVFGPMWTTLYFLMAVAIWDVVRRDVEQAKPAIGAFAVQLTLNALWSPVFFGLQLSGIGLALISALWLAIVGCIALYAPRSRLAAGITVPYLAWISVAWSLNAWIWWFN